MATNSVFEKLSYRAFLLASLGAPGRRNGLRTSFAHAIGCHPAYLTKILAGGAELSLEQALNLSSFLKLSPAEEAFFLLLLQKERAGTSKLREHFQKQIDGVLKSRLALKERLAPETALNKNDEAIYYSAWFYAAIHVLISISALQTKNELAQYLQLPAETINEVLEFLVRTGLATEEKGRFRMGPVHIHLGADSLYISRHHSHWRMQAIAALDIPALSDVHYSAVVTLSKKDAERIKEKIIRILKDDLQDIADSKAEVAYVYNIDFFSLKKGMY